MLGLQENVYIQVPNTSYMSAGEAGRHVVGFLDLFIDIFLEVQNKRYSQILYIIDYVVPVFLVNKLDFQDNLPEP